MKKQPLIILQDGAVDELMSVVLAATIPGITIAGIGVVNADCLATPTMQVTCKILDLLGLQNIPVTKSVARGVNPFPWSYRQYSMMANLLPMLNTGYPKQPVLINETTEDMLIRLITKNMQQGNPKMKVLVLSPLTPLVTAWQKEPAIKDGIAEIIWMGGALKPKGDNCGMPYGNVDTGIAPGANSNAEWNAYWDPYAVKNVLASKVPLTMFPLNATNLVMLTPEKVLQFAPNSNKYPLYALAGQMYCTVAFEGGYAFWDTVTTAYLGKPDLFTIKKMKLANITEGDNQGNITEDAKGKDVNVVTEVKVNGFYEYIFKQWKYLKA
jgi:purine nucleosidase